MTSTPVSLKDGSLEGSWVDIRCATITQTSANPTNEYTIPDNSDQCRSSPYCMIGNNNTGRVSFQVQRFLQESQRATDTNNLGTSSSQTNISQLNIANDDSQSLVYLSDDSDELSRDGFDSKALFESLKAHNTSCSMSVQFMDSNTIIQNNPEATTTRATTLNTNDLQQYNKQLINNNPINAQQQKSVFRNADYTPDQLSDSLSLLSRASGGVIGAGESDFQELDWLWDWTAQPEYFTGQEWKVYVPKQEYLLRQRQLYRNNDEHSIGKDMASLLVLTNVLSIIIGAGLTYGILARKNGV